MILTTSVKLGPKTVINSQQITRAMNNAKTYILSQMRDGKEFTFASLLTDRKKLDIK